jgi:hypothetical protein
MRKCAKFFPIYGEAISHIFLFSFLSVHLRTFLRGKNRTTYILYVDHVIISGEEERPKSSLQLFANSKTPVFFCRITGTEIGSRCLSCQTFASFFKLLRSPGIDCANKCSLCWNLRTIYLGAVNLLGIELSYLPVKLHRLAESIPRLPKSIKLLSLAGRKDNPIPTRFLAPIDCSKTTFRFKFLRAPLDCH